MAGSLTDERSLSMVAASCSSSGHPPSRGNSGERIPISRFAPRSMARPPEDPETLEPGFLFEWYINPTFPSPFYVAGGSGVAPAAVARSPACDSDSDSDSRSDGSGSARGAEDVAGVGPGAAAGGGAESGPMIDSDRRESISESARRAAVDEADPRRPGLRVVSIDSDSDSDSEYLESENVCSFDLESQRNLATELEWEEVSEQAHDRDEEEVTVSSENFTEELEGGEELSNVEMPGRMIVKES